jgi:ABC-type Fe3+ transport system permease subunit
MFLVWGGAGLGMLIFLAGMRSIPEELYEAARIDGAGRIRSFRSITLPLLTPILMFQIVTGMIVVSSMFQEPLLLSPNLQAGLGTYVPEGTHVFNIEALQQIMVTGDWGYGAAEIWLFVPILLCLAVIFFSGVYSEASSTVSAAAVGRQQRGLSAGGARGGSAVLLYATVIASPPSASSEASSARFVHLGGVSGPVIHPLRWHNYARSTTPA